MQPGRHLCATLLAALLGAMVNAASAAPPLRPSPPAPPSPPGAAALTGIEGTVRRVLITPYGEPNGVRLDDGTVVLLPPHLSARLAGAVAVGDRVRVIGQPASGGAVRAQALVNLASGSAVDGQGDGRPGAPPPPPLAAPRLPLQQLAVQGVIDVVLHGPRGEANGVILADGAIIYFRPDLVAAPLAPGQPFAAEGIGTRGAAGLAIEAISTNVNPDQP